MTTHSSILACRILWTEEPDGPQSVGSQSWTRLKRLSTHTKYVNHFAVLISRKKASKVPMVK